MSNFFLELLAQGVNAFSKATGVAIPLPPQKQQKTFSASVVRADDLLVLDLDFFNLKLTSQKQLKLDDENGDAFIIAHVPPQSIVERAFAEDQPGWGDTPLGPPVEARLSGESKLVFHVDPSLLPLDFELTKILAALSRSTPLVREQIGRPTETPPTGITAEFDWPFLFSLGSHSQFTAIELPWRLILSPHPDGRWAHAAAPVSEGDKTELWHTRLGVRSASGSAIDERSTDGRIARAVYSPDFTTPHPRETNIPFRSSLSGRDRSLIVLSTADRSLPGNAPVAVERLMLTSLGAWLQVQGNWDSNQNFDLVEWRHLTNIPIKQMTHQAA
jgi:hypothetical protein